MQETRVQPLALKIPRAARGSWARAPRIGSSCSEPADCSCPRPEHPGARTTARAAPQAACGAPQLQKQARGPEPAQPGSKERITFYSLKRKLSPASDQLHLVFCRKGQADSSCGVQVSQSTGVTGARRASVPAQAEAWDRGRATAGHQATPHESRLEWVCVECACRQFEPVSGLLPGFHNRWLHCLQ